MPDNDYYGHGKTPVPQDNPHPYGSDAWYKVKQHNQTVAFQRQQTGYVPPRKYDRYGNPI